MSEMSPVAKERICRLTPVAQIIQKGEKKGPRR